MEQLTRITYVSRASFKPLSKKLALNRMSHGFYPNRGAIMCVVI